MESRKVTTGIILENTEIAKDVFELRVEASLCGDFVPGQFVNVYLDDKSRLLPRPISICGADSETVCVVYKTVGEGTKSLSEYSVGKEIKISSPLGNGYNLKENYFGKKVALVAGGIGLPPMIGLAEALHTRNAKIDVFLGFQSETFLCAGFKKFSENVFVATDDGSFGFHGNVIDLLRQADVTYTEYFSCGPKKMLGALSAYASSLSVSAQVSVEERMGCGFGACVGCACKVMSGGEATYKSVCKHGPVFCGAEVVWNE